MRPIEVVKKVCPQAKQSYLNAFEAADNDFKRFGITTPERLSGFLSQVLAETGGLKILYESGQYTSAKRLLEIFGPKHSANVTPEEADRLVALPPDQRERAIFERVYGLGNPKKARELGNTQPGDGFRYRGTGPMQMTGRDNFRRIGTKIGADLENKPDDALLPQYLLLPAFVEWDEGKLNQYADNADVLSISRAINLGNPHSTGTPNGLSDREYYWRRCLATIDQVDLKPAAPITASPKVQAGVATVTVAVATTAATTAAVQAGFSWWQIGLLLGILVVAGGIAFYLNQVKKGG